MSPEEYNPLLSQTSPSNVVLRHIFATSARRNFSSRAAAPPQVTAEVAHEIRDDSIVFTHTYKATVMDESSDSNLMVIQAVFELSLQTEGRYPEAFALEYANRQLVIQTRPYFRELVANMAPRFLIQVPPIHTFIIPPLPSKPEEAKDVKPKRKATPVVTARASSKKVD